MELAFPLCYCGSGFATALPPKEYNMSRFLITSRPKQPRGPQWREEMQETIHEHQLSRRRFFGRAAAAIGSCGIIAGLAQLDAYSQQAAADNASKALVPARSPLKITKLETFIHKNSWVFV